MEEKGFTEPLRHFIEEYASRIDAALEKLHPRSMSRAYLEQITGELRYADLGAILTHGISEPNFSLLDRSRSRIRPILFLLTLGGLGTDPDEFVDFSATCELFHNGTLIHDDIEDNAEIRRNEPPVHAIYGTDIAVNSANFMYFAPLMLIDNYVDKLGAEKATRLYRVIAKQMINVTFGQAADIFWHKNNLSIAENEYYQMAAFKTGGVDRYALVLSGVLADVDEVTLERIDHYGQMVGIAFQVHDDTFDLIAYDRRAFGGKPIGNDVTEGKKSLVMVKALSTLPKQQANRLGEILRLNTRDPDLIKEAIKLAYEGGAIEYAVQAGERFFQRLVEETEVLYRYKPYCSMLSRFWEHMRSDLVQEYQAFIERMTDITENVWGR
jgi:geranylgeranyl pyrophosphate synthase